MTTSNTVAIILAAGLGTRMGSTHPKVLHPIAGRPMILELLDNLSKVDPEEIILVIGPDMEAVSDIVKYAGFDVQVVVQKERRGTGHAVQQVKKHLSGFNGNVLILYGDSPLINAETMLSMLEARNQPTNPAIVVLGFKSHDKSEYGRLLLNENEMLTAIVESKDASEKELNIDLCNSGMMVVDGAILFDLTSKLSDTNVKGELYLTDVVKYANGMGRVCSFIEGDEVEAIGINSRSELAVAESVVQDRLRKRAMDCGATLIDPGSVFFSYDTSVGQDVIIGPNVFFGLGVEIHDGVHIKSFSHIEGTKIESNAIIGPFARLRPGTGIGQDVHIGNFVEIKNAKLEPGVKANHLSYIGDARVGSNANIGAGTITCNYDGYIKSTTEIGADAFIGSNTSLVAPVKIGKKSVTGAGSVITKNVAPGALAITRPDQKIIKGYASKLRTSREEK